MESIRSFFFFVAQTTWRCLGNWKTIGYSTWAAAIERMKREDQFPRVRRLGNRTGFNTMTISQRKRFLCMEKWCEVAPDIIPQQQQHQHQLDQKNAGATSAGPVQRPVQVCARLPTRSNAKDGTDKL